MRLSLRYLALVLGLALFSGTAYAHDFYTKWKDADGISCCNKTDCRPAKIRWNVTKWQVWLRGQWCDIPAAKVRPYTHPDKGPHVCADKSSFSNGTCQMYCFVHGEAKL